MHRISYSQFGEDIVAWNALRNATPGFYVDVGAHHPIKLSNTARMHLEGWDGINVEPRADAIELFERHRPRATNLRLAIHNELDVVTLHKFRGGRIDTVIADRARMLANSKDAVGAEDVPAMSLDRLFEEHVPAGTRVNYLSVDIEGYDREAILAFDLDRHRPDVVCIELHDFDPLALGSNPVVRHFKDAGYHPFAINIMSFTFVREDAAGRLGIHRLNRA
ncbi:FkbM family methyltransferase [Nocardioides sp. TF02-7]|uniref:FkbM family methyltransferase n=1 Tax=Nocardioides sp. TF02-7 TaxID=2917724 RepID=UPI001F069BB7|nr:FkbM family methyltransferase [Nocardioides sp. TF02-7]UMG93048.1 FkbM family methyltransferase [Nocardioides sp. TF02-7]